MFSINPQWNFCHSPFFSKQRCSWNFKIKLRIRLKFLTFLFTNKSKLIVGAWLEKQPKLIDRHYVHIFFICTYYVSCSFHMCHQTSMQKMSLLHPCSIFTDFTVYKFHFQILLVEFLIHYKILSKIFHETMYVWL